MPAVPAAACWAEHIITVCMAGQHVVLLAPGLLWSSLLPAARGLACRQNCGSCPPAGLVAVPAQPCRTVAASLSPHHMPGTIVAGLCGGQWFSKCSKAALSWTGTPGRHNGLLVGLVHGAGDLCQQLVARDARRHCVAWRRTVHAKFSARHTQISTRSLPIATQQMHSRRSCVKCGCKACM